MLCAAPRFVCADFLDHGGILSLRVASEGKVILSARSLPQVVKYPLCQLIGHEPRRTDAIWPEHAAFGALPGCRTAILASLSSPLPTPSRSLFPVTFISKTWGNWSRQRSPEQAGLRRNSIP